MQQKVWFLSELYYPEDTSTGHYVTGVAEGLADTFDVRVVTVQPTYSRRGEKWPAFEVRNGVRIERCLATTLDKNVLAYRLTNMATLASSMTLRISRRIGHGDVVVVGTNPPVLPLVALAVCRARGARCLVRMDDIYPDAAIGAGLIAAGGPVAALVEACQQFVYHRADGLVFMGRCMAERVSRKTNGSMAPHVVIPNFADVELVQPAPREGNELRERFRLQGKFVVIVAGNLGRVQGLEVVVEAAKQLESDCELHFLLVGTGAKVPWLQAEISRNHLKNVTLTGALPRAEQNTFLGAGDVALITLASGMVGAGVPSRIYNFMAAGMPVIAAGGLGSEVNLVVEEEEIGWSIPSGAVDRLVDAIRQARQSSASLATMGTRARHAAETRFSREVVTRAYATAVHNLATGKQIGC